MNPRTMAKFIRMKKMDMEKASPEIVQGMPNPKMNPQDIWDNEKTAYFETLMDVPEKIDADETMMSEPDDEMLRKMDMSKMSRIQSYFDALGM